MQVSPSYNRHMQALLTALYDRFETRARWWPLGLFPFQSEFRLHKLRIGSQWVELQIPPGEEAAQQWELQHLYLDDPYGFVHWSAQGIHRVLDIGGNVGFASLLSRHYFPQAKIHCYEPNPRLRPFLEGNLKGLDVQIYPEAVGAHSGQADLSLGGDSLQSSLVPGETGSIPICAFEKALRRLGGVDLLKMDCEGGEWEIFEDQESFSQVRYLAMEYHLQHAPGRTLLRLLDLLLGMGFRIDYLRESSNRDVGQLRATNIRIPAVA